MSLINTGPWNLQLRLIRPLAVVVASLAVVSTAAACGSDTPASAADPSVPDAATATASPVPTATPDVAAIYIVKPGDTGIAIADSFGITLGDLARANDMTEIQLNVLHIGQELRIPR